MPPSGGLHYFYSFNVGPGPHLHALSLFPNSGLVVLFFISFLHAFSFGVLLSRCMVVLRRYSSFFVASLCQVTLSLFGLLSFVSIRPCGLAAFRLVRALCRVLCGLIRALCYLFIVCFPFLFVVFGSSLIRVVLLPYTVVDPRRGP